MSNPTINANICETEGGPYYRVLLHTIPRVGELIDLYSYLDQESKKYEVVRVLHKLHDVTEKFPKSENGCHEVSVYVKHIQSEFPD